MQELEYDQTPKRGANSRPRKADRNGVTFCRREYIVPEELSDTVREAVAEMVAAYLVMAGKAQIKGKGVPLPLMQHYTRIAVLRSERAALATASGTRGDMLREDNSAMLNAALQDFDRAMAAYQANARRAREQAIAAKAANAANKVAIKS